jgi:hypothetical protein
MTIGISAVRWDMDQEKSYRALRPSAARPRTYACVGESRIRRIPTSHTCQEIHAGTLVSRTGGWEHRERRFRSRLGVRVLAEVANPAGAASLCRLGRVTEDWPGRWRPTEGGG